MAAKVSILDENGPLDEAASPREGGAVYVGCVAFAGLSGGVLGCVIRLDFRLMWPKFMNLDERVSRCPNSETA